MYRRRHKVLHPSIDDFILSTDGPINWYREHYRDHPEIITRDLLNSAVYEFRGRNNDENSRVSDLLYEKNEERGEPAGTKLPKSVLDQIAENTVLDYYRRLMDEAAAKRASQPNQVQTMPYNQPVNYAPLERNANSSVLQAVSGPYYNQPQQVYAQPQQPVQQQRYATYGNQQIPVQQPPVQQQPRNVEWCPLESWVRTPQGNEGVVSIDFGHGAQLYKVRCMDAYRNGMFSWYRTCNPINQMPSQPQYQPVSNMSGYVGDQNSVHQQVPYSNRNLPSLQTNGTRSYNVNFNNAAPQQNYVQPQQQTQQYVQPQYNQNQTAQFQPKPQPTVQVLSANKLADRPFGEIPVDDDIDPINIVTDKVKITIDRSCRKIDIVVSDKDGKVVPPEPDDSKKTITLEGEDPYYRFKHTESDLYRRDKEDDDGVLSATLEVDAPVVNLHEAVTDVVTNQAVKLDVEHRNALKQGGSVADIINYNEMSVLDIPRAVATRMFREARRAYLGREKKPNMRNIRDMVSAFLNDEYEGAGLTVLRHMLNEFNRLASVELAYQDANGALHCLFIEDIDEFVRLVTPPTSATADRDEFAAFRKYSKFEEKLAYCVGRAFNGVLSDNAIMGDKYRDLMLTHPEVAAHFPHFGCHGWNLRSNSEFLKLSQEAQDEVIDRKLRGVTGYMLKKSFMLHNLDDLRMPTMQQGVRIIDPNKSFGLRLVYELVSSRKVNTLVSTRSRCGYESQVPVTVGIDLDDRLVARRFVNYRV